MSLDPRTPVIVAAAQYTQRVAEGDPLLEPADLMVETLRRAERDSGGKGVLAAGETGRPIRLSSARYGDPARLVAERMGAKNVRQTAFATNGGQVVGTVVARTAEDILSGAFDVAVVVGGETWKSHLTAQRAGRELQWTPQPDGTEPDIVIGPPLDFRHPVEDAVGATMPVHIYPIIENAMRAAAGRTITEHQAYLGQLWRRFSQVAVDNPYAWDRTPYTAEQIVNPSPANRMVSFPYTKLMMSNEQVDQAAGIVMCTVERARAFGVPEESWVFPYACSEASAPTVAERPDLAVSPMLRACGDALWKTTGLGPDDVSHVDLYSCFPSAVQQQAMEFGLGVDRQLTVTGGMRFSGGPWNNYALQGLAGMVTVLRDDPGSIGLCTANGGYISKQAAIVYSTTPPPQPFHSVGPFNDFPNRAVDMEPSGPATVESYTVMHDRAGEATTGIVVCRMPDDRRAWGNISEPAVLTAMEKEDPIGQS